MTGNMQRSWGQTAAMAPNNAEANDDNLDNISLTSTVVEDYSPETEFAVEGIRAEKIVNGSVMYLVEWTNFPLDQCTYEPEENLQDVLKSEWEEKKLRDGPNIGEQFRKKVEAITAQKLEESQARHRRRNAKRRRLGLSTTRFHFQGVQYPDSEDDPDEFEEDTQSEDFESEDSHNDQDSLKSDEAEEEHQAGHKAAETLISLKPQTKSKPQSPSTRTLSSNPGQAASKERKENVRTVKNSAQAHNQGPTLSSQGDKPSSRPRELPSSTGYQGSARKPSSDNIHERHSQTMNSSLPTRPPKTALPARPPNTSIPARSTGAAPTKSPAKPTANRTKHQGVNIFTAGKQRKKRTRGNAPEKPQFYRYASILRKSELKSRNREDDAPAIEKLNHVFTPGGPIAGSQRPGSSADIVSDKPADSDGSRAIVQEIGAQSIPALPPQIKRPVRTVSEPKSVLSTSKRRSLASESGPVQKRAKSVRFTGVCDEPTTTSEPRSVRFNGADEKFVSEPMDIDEGAELTSLPIVSTGQNFSVREHQSVNKIITLAKSSNQILNTTFHTLPKIPDSELEPPWLRTFLNVKYLCLSHTVLAETLMSQLPSLGPQALENLSSGSITSAEDESALETVAEHLRVGRLGLFMPHKEFNLLVYPAKCDGFNLETFGAGPTTSDETALKYFFFTSTCPISQLIRPSNSNLNLSDMQMAVGQELPMLFTKVFGVRLTQLGGGGSKHKPKQFFFAFPARAADWQTSFCCWLHQRDPRCKIYTNAVAGSWAAFVERALHEPGVIIIHEALVPFIRRFPGICKLLQADCCVWRFSESPDPPHASSSPKLLGNSVVPPVLSRIFTLGTAILITPSFMLSQPQEAFQLFKWFFRNRTAVTYNKLVTAYNIHDYLHGLAANRSRHRDLLRATRWEGMRKDVMEIEMDQSALTNEDVEASQRTWLEVTRWLSQQLEADMPLSEENHVIYAEPTIDPNDEQSLVNWFGWWSLVRNNEYRNFYVVGSDGSSRHTDAKPLSISRITRELRIPAYGLAVVNDPDASIGLPKKPCSDSSTTNAAGPDAERDRSAWFQSQEYFRNGEGDIQKWLFRSGDRRGFSKVFGFPVSWVDMEMADHFGDSYSTFRRYKQWWDYVLPWLGDEGKKFNTYIALFYTIQDDWLPNNFPQGLKPRRHPWIVIYRPVEPHKKIGGYKHGKNELIIWDLRAGDELEGKENISLTDLTWMQQELVRFVQLHTSEKNPGSVLQKVWLGGFQVHQSRCRCKLPMDMTAEFLQLVIEELHDTIPSPANVMHMKGYRLVDFDEALLAPTQRMRPSTALSTEEPSEDTRIIFHPPRGGAKLHATGTSLCTNDLFEASRVAKLRNATAEEMTYTYRPTMDWYAQQQAEGRQFEHIHVGEWREVFQALEVYKNLKTPTSAVFTPQAGQQPGFGCSRRSSASSNQSSPRT